jgi:hypothetical protein
MSDIASRQHGRIDWLTRTDLEPKMRQVCEYLDRATRKCREAWWSAERIARDLGEGFSVATVRVILRKLTLRGLIAVVVDYGLKTRRAIVLLWRKAAEPVVGHAPTSDVMKYEVTQAADPAAIAQAHAEGAMRDDLRRVRREDVPANAAPAAAAEAAPPVPSRGGDAEARKATPEEKAELISEALKVKGATRPKVWLLATNVGISVLLPCVRWAAAKGKGWRWVEAVAPAWKQEGVPEDAMSPPARERSQAEIIAELFGPGGKYAESTFDMTPYLGLRLHDD